MQRQKQSQPRAKENSHEADKFWLLIADLLLLPMLSQKKNRLRSENISLRGLKRSGPVSDDNICRFTLVVTGQVTNDAEPPDWNVNLGKVTIFIYGGYF